jgi:hypothetical protein
MALSAARPPARGAAATWTRFGPSIVALSLADCARVKSA